MQGEELKQNYFVSGMWCSTCAQNVRKAAGDIEGVSSVGLNYITKILTVYIFPTSDIEEVDSSIQKKIRDNGFGIRKLSNYWLRDFYKLLEHEHKQKIPWTVLCLVWFLAMWSSMLAFTGYIGGGISYEEHYYLAIASAAFGIPAICLGVLPYANSGLRALIYGKLLSLDLFVFLGGCSAIIVSVIALTSYSNATFADSGAMVIAILLTAKKTENSLFINTTKNILFQFNLGNEYIQLLKNNVWSKTEISKIKKSARVKVFKGQTIPLDGDLEDSTAIVNNHLLSGETNPITLKKGDDVLAGAIALSDFEFTVRSPQGERKIDNWAEKALLSQSDRSMISKLFSRIESFLVLISFFGALSIFVFQFVETSSISNSIEAFFIGIIVFCPCLFASIIPLSKQISMNTLRQRGVLVHRIEALLQLSGVKNFYFDKTGTLEAVEASFHPIANNGIAVLPYLKAVCENSKHPIMRNLNIECVPIPLRKIDEIPGKGLIAIAKDNTQIHIGRASFLASQGIAIQKLPVDVPIVAVNKVVSGHIINKNKHKEQTKSFLKDLFKFKPWISVYILSGDPRQTAGHKYSDLNLDLKYIGNLSPEEKAERIFPSSVFIGDGLNDSLAMAKADVSMRLGYRVQSFTPTDFQFNIPDLELVLSTIKYAKKYKEILTQTAGAALLYNIIALTLATLGKFTPIGAVLAMVCSFTLMLFSIYRLKMI